MIIFLPSTSDGRFFLSENMIEISDITAKEIVERLPRIIDMIDTNVLDNREYNNIRILSRVVKSLMRKIDKQRKD